MASTKSRKRKVKTTKTKEEEKVKGSFFVGIVMIILGGLLILGVLLSGFGTLFSPEIRAYFLQDSIMNFIYGVIFIVTAWGIIEAEEWALGVLSITLFLIICNRTVALIHGTENIPLYLSIPIIVGAIFLIIYLYRTRKKYD